MTLGVDDIHLWISFERTADEPALQALRPLLQPAEIARIDKAYSAEVGLRFLAARAMARTVLARYAPGVEPAALRFVTGEYGKPALAPEFAALGLHFNVTHARGLVGIAVGRHPDLGVDAENLRERTTALKLARRYFTDDESRNLEALPPDEQPARFLSLWTLKEAWMKATGRGIAAGLGNAAFSLDGKHRVVGVHLAAHDRADWRFWQFTPTHEHVVALALRAPGAIRDANVSTYEWRPGTSANPL
jgi:4'-phosphopantetheinyl transferase